MANCAAGIACLGWRWAFRRRWQVVELPEPLWLRALPLTVSVGLAVRLSDLLLRRRTRIVTYGMENQEPELLMGRNSRGLHKFVFGLIRQVGGAMHDRVAFASESARECYTAARVLPTGARRPRSRNCRKCVSAIVASARETDVLRRCPRRRKGLPDLLAAWHEADLAAEGGSSLSRIRTACG